MQNKQDEKKENLLSNFYFLSKFFFLYSKFLGYKVYSDEIRSILNRSSPKD